MEERVYQALAGDENKRLDLFLSEKEVFSRSYLQKMIARGEVWVNQSPQKAHYRLKEGDVVVFRASTDSHLLIEPQNIPLDIVYEDGEILVVNKVRGQIVHPTAMNLKGTLVNALLFHCQRLSSLEGPLRPGIVHRLDKETSGLMVVAKNNEAHQKLKDQLKAGQIKREYLALVQGRMEKKEGVIDAPIGRDFLTPTKRAVTIINSKRAVTYFQVVKFLRQSTLIKATLETGRTHQIRVHFSYIGHPVIGDTLYGHSQNLALDFTGHALHAESLEFFHPTRDEKMRFSVPLPSDMKELISRLTLSNYLTE